VWYAVPRAADAAVGPSVAVAPGRRQTLRRLLEQKWTDDYANGCFRSGRRATFTVTSIDDPLPGAGRCRVSQLPALRGERKAARRPPRVTGARPRRPHERPHISFDGTRTSRFVAPDFVGELLRHVRDLLFEAAPRCEPFPPVADTRMRS
jgi:hypothetical protein